MRRQLPARMSTARAFPPCVPSSPPSDIICDLWFAACASLSVCYIYDHARSAAIRAPCHRAPNIDTRCNRSFRQTLRPAVKIAKVDIPRISTPSRVDLHQHPCDKSASIQMPRPNTQLVDVGDLPANMSWPNIQVAELLSVFLCLSPTVFRFDYHGLAWGCAMFSHVCAHDAHA